MIKEVCYKLKERRRELGYSVEYVVEKTKLHPLVIRDIEECNLNNVGTIYIRGFIKIYASFLNVDLGSSLDEIGQKKPLQKVIEKSQTKEREASSIISERISRIKSITGKISPEVKRKIVLIFIGIAFLWVIFGVGKFIVRKIPKMIKKPVKIKKAKQPKITLPITRVDGVLASLTAKRKCFIRARIDGKILFEGILNKGVVETWQGKKEIEFRISDGSAIYLEVNGKAIPTLTSIRRPIKSLKITPSGISVDK